MKKILCGFFAFFLFFPVTTYAQGAAPELFGVREIILQYTTFGDPKASETCGLSREQISAAIMKQFSGTGVPVILAADAKPPTLGVARINLIPAVYAHTDENLNCISYVSLVAQNRVNAVIPPVTTLRGVTVLYWQQHTTVASNQSTHSQLISDVMQKMAEMFAQQYRLDQPPELAK